METFLPLNLRGFLLAELGSRVRIDDHVVAPTDPESSENFLRDLARAIRRFSFKRAHEPWVEAGVGADLMLSAMEAAIAGRTQVVLCLHCATVAVGLTAMEEHSAADCLGVRLHELAAAARGEAGELTVPVLRHLLYQLLENFRASREVAELPHFDLDYYARGGQIVFTWRSLRE